MRYWSLRHGRSLFTRLVVLVCMLNPSVKLLTYGNPFVQCRAMGRTLMLHLSFKCNHGIWDRGVVLLLYTSSCNDIIIFGMPNTSVKLYGNPFLQYRVIARIRMVAYLHLNCRSLKCDIELWDRGPFVSRDTSAWYAKHLC